MKNKTWYIIAGVVVAALLGWYFFMKKPAVVATSNPVSEAWEKEVQNNLAWMRKDPKTVAFIKDKATANKVPYETQLRNDAEYYAEMNGFKRA